MACLERISTRKILFCQNDDGNFSLFRKRPRTMKMTGNFCGPNTNENHYNNFATAFMNCNSYFRFKIKI